MPVLPALLAEAAPETWWALSAGLVAFGLTAAIGALLVRRKGGRAGSRPGGVTADDDSPDDRAEIGRDFSERRQSFRRGGVPVKVDIAEGQELEEAWVVDRSKTGLGLHMDKPLKKGAVIKVRPRQAIGAGLWVEVVVANCRAEEDYWKVGCQFVVPPDYGVLRLFG